jgi:hypothetical protein
MHAVSPEVPVIAFGLDEQPDLLSRAIEDQLVAQGHNPEAWEAEAHAKAMDKAMTYTVMHAVGRSMVRLAIVGEGHEARFAPDVQPSVESARSPSFPLDRLFSDSFRLTRQQQPWIRAIGPHYDQIATRHFFRTGTPAQYGLLSQNLQGGAIGTLRSLAELVHKLQCQEGIVIEQATPFPVIDEILEDRRYVMHHLAYLALSRAGRNVDAVPSANLSDLKGEIRELPPHTAGGKPRLIFRSTDASRWKQVFPARQPEDYRMPTLKCPLHQLNLQPAHELSEADLAAEAATPLISMVAATINFLGDNRRLLTGSEEAGVLRYDLAAAYRSHE